MLLFFPIYTLGSDSASQNLGICALYRDSSLVMYFFFLYLQFCIFKDSVILIAEYESSI